MTERAWEWIEEYGNYDAEELEDDNEVRRLYIHAWLGDNDLYDIDKLIT